MSANARMEAAATRDLAARIRYVAEDCIFSSDDGVLVTKAQMLGHSKKLPAEYDRAVDPREHVVHPHGDTAVVNYRATTHEQFGAADIISEQRRTETLPSKTALGCSLRSNGTICQSIFASRVLPKEGPTRTMLANINGAPGTTWRPFLREIADMVSGGRRSSRVPARGK